MNHEKEADRILYEDPNPETGFLILPDLKWDQKTISTLVRGFPAIHLEWLVTNAYDYLLLSVLVCHRLRQVD